MYWNGVIRMINLKDYENLVLNAKVKKIFNFFEYIFVNNSNINIDMLFRQIDPYLLYIQ